MTESILGIYGGVMSIIGLTLINQIGVMGYVLMSTFPLFLELLNVIGVFNE